MKFEEESEKTKQKIYYFFGSCEFITVCEADNKSEALKEYLQTNPTDKFDLILELNKKDANHTVYRYFN